MTLRNDALPSHELSLKALNRPPDWEARQRALDPARSFLVQAPAGSGKTELLIRRFLRLLGEAEKPDEIVAITFTNAAAAEMRQRVLAALERAEKVTNPALESESGDAQVAGELESLEGLAAQATERARRLDWKLLDQPNQLRIMTIDSFCRSLALQSPLSWGVLAGLGGRLDQLTDADEIYRQAARRTLAALDGGDTATRQSVEALLKWRDNNWADIEALIVKMLKDRNRWFQGFVLGQKVDEAELRSKLEAPFMRAARGLLEKLGKKLDALEGSREGVLKLARVACKIPGKDSPFALAERAELPGVFKAEAGEDERQLLRDALDAYGEVADFLLTGSSWRKKGGLNLHRGFPGGAEGKPAKDRFGDLVDGLAQEPGLVEALAAFQKRMPLGYTEEEWELLRHCFAVLRAAAAQLQVLFAETGSVDFTEVAQIALRVLAPEGGFASDIAQRQAAGIRHLLIDEFQDTSRRQHELLARIIGAWPEREGRSCFCVGDPMQSIYGFREAEVELFERLKTHGLDVSASDPDGGAFRFEFVALRANFRTAKSLVDDLNGHFEAIFAEDDGSGVRFARAVAAREQPAGKAAAVTELHLAFTRNGKGFTDDDPNAPERTRETQVEELVALVKSKLPEIEAARAAAGGDKASDQKAGKYRVAVLGRTRPALLVVAEGLRAAGIGFRAIELVKLRERPEVLDVLALVRALLNPMDRTAWLGVLRAPWCGLSLEELHLLTAADNAGVSAAAIPTLIKERLPQLLREGGIGSRAAEAAARVGRVLRQARELRASGAGLAMGAGLASGLGSWIEAVWTALGGSDTVNEEQRSNLRLLWSCLDGLPSGELDLLGPGLESALEKLFAQPDPAMSSEFGVQLMTIHHSKGLEFEVVIVPDLEVRGKPDDPTMISWLERAIAEDEDEGENGNGGDLTEFLIAPIQAKGQEKGAAKAWVDGVKRERVTQELRRVLYVAATRAREELHLFARPRFSEKVTAKSTVPERELVAAGGLMATAWPALEMKVRERFAVWKSDRAEQTGLSLAAAAAVAGNVLTMPGGAAVKPTLMRRLPEGYAQQSTPRLYARTHASAATAAAEQSADLPENLIDDETARPTLFSRTEGGLYSRLDGTAIHALMERLARLRVLMESREAATALAASLPGIIAMARGAGLPALAAQGLAADAIAVVQRTLEDAAGAWVLAPHAEAEIESRWTAVLAPETGSADRDKGRRWNLRPDRVFHSEGMDGGSAAWWVIDYKTSRAPEHVIADARARADFLGEHRTRYEGQLAAYARVLRALQGGPDTLPVRAGVYYPRLRLFDWWEA